ncbi:MAG: L-arabinose isomerase family protein [Kiritimatiellia bacterium]
MKRQPKAGLLPLYLKLYDEATPERRAQFEPFLQQIRSKLVGHGIEIVMGPICRVADEFRSAVQTFVAEKVECIVSLHLAYSPSLESADALADSGLPIVILDTTMDRAFGPDIAPDRIMYNHGIHGVMDLASVLRRRHYRFAIVAGSANDAAFVKRATDFIRAACASRRLRATRALRVGPPFHGMGDFAVDEAVLERELGIRVTEIGLAELASAACSVSKADIENELRLDQERFVCEVPEEVHRYSLQAGLALRHVLETGTVDALSMNFLAFDRAEEPIATVPFLEASKAMARGIGYAGEGDVLTAALVGALNSVFPGTTFTEIFCPDWAGNSLFLSHMGEVNPELAAETPRLIEKDFPFTPARNPAVLVCGLRPGPAVFANLAPGPHDKFGLIVAPVEIIQDTTREDMRRTVRGWMRPPRNVPWFLEQYSLRGGTHHSALVPGALRDAVLGFGQLAGLECHVLE